MNMDPYLQTGLGIIVSVLLFLIGYRQTIGARKERIKAANEKLIDTILKRIILEKYQPKRDDILRIIEGNARNYKVKPKDLLTTEQVINTLYTKIFENDLITQEQRDQNIDKLTPLFEDEKKDQKQEIDLIVSKPIDRSRKLINVITLSLGLISTLIGVLFTSFDKLFSSNFEFSSLNYTTIIALVGSLIAITTIYFFIRFKDTQESGEEKASDDPLKDSISFEKEVFKIFKRMNLNTTIPTGRDLGIDIIAKNGKTLAIQIKYVRMRPPIAYMRQLMTRLAKGMSDLKIDQGLIILPKTYRLNDILKMDQNIRIVDLNDLKDYFKK